MSCEEVGAKLSLYVAGDIERQGAGEAIAAHLGACESCRALAAEWQSSRRMLLLHAPPEFDATFFDGVRRDVLRQISEPPAPSLFARLLGQPFGQRTMAYAAAFSVLVCAVILSSHFLNQKPTPDVAVVDQGKDTPGDAQPTGPRPPDAAEHGGETNQEGLTVSNPQPTPPRRGVRRARAGAPEAARKERLLNPPEARESAEAASVRAVEGDATASAAREASATVEGSERLAETATADRKMLRIEFQTSDPNVRIIWLSPQASDRASSDKAKR